MQRNKGNGGRSTVACFGARCWLVVNFARCLVHPCFDTTSWLAAVALVSVR